MEGNRVADGADLVQYVDGLRAAARKMTLSDPDAEDLVQDCLASAVQGGGRLRRVELIGAWLHQILRRRWYDLLRRRALERRRQAEGRPAAAPTDADPAGGELIRRALGALDLDDRRVLEMRFFQSRTSVEIARELGRPEGTVRSQLFHALRRFESEFRRLCPKETV